MNRKVLWVLGLNNFLRGLSQGILTPGLLWTIENVINKQLNASDSWFLLSIAILESFQVIGKLIVYLFLSWSFPRGTYFRLILVSILSGVLYISCFYGLGIFALLFALALQGLNVGCLDKIEVIFTAKLFEANDIKKFYAFKASRCFGLIMGPLLGYLYFRVGDLNISGIPISIFVIPGVVQVLCGVIMFFAFIFTAFEIPSPVNSHDTNLTGTHEATTLATSSLTLQKKIDHSHLPIFTVMFISLIFSLSRSIKEVALPVLIKAPEIFPLCKCQETYNIDGAYLAFALISVFETLSSFGAMICLGRPQKEIKYWNFVPLVLSLVGQCLMVSSGQISIGLLASGLSLQALSMPFGIGITGNLFHELVGNEPPSYFSIVYMLLDLLGSLIGPFWTIQAYQVKCELCFALIGICVGFSSIIMGLSIKALLDLETIKNDQKLPFLEYTSSREPETPMLNRSFFEAKSTEMVEFKKKIN